jgi:hypothetical protein
MKPEDLKGELQDLYGECFGQCKNCLYDGDCELQDKLKE